MAAPISRTDSASLKGKGKKPKRFLERIVELDTLELATAIAGAQEEKSLCKAERHHQPEDQRQASQKPRLSAAKAKLKETKALLAAQRSQLKADRVKRRKQRPQDDLQKGDVDRDPGAKPRASGKKVSFA